MPNKVEDPVDPSNEFGWERLGTEDRREQEKAYQRQREIHSAYLEALASWRADRAVHGAPKRLRQTVRELEQRGLLQYESGERRYDLHPVVRGVVAGRMDAGKKQDRGTQVVNYFNSQLPDNWDDADSLEDLAPGLQLVATMTQIGRYEEAANLYTEKLSNPLRINLSAHAEALAVLRSFFPNGWDGDTSVQESIAKMNVLNDAALNFRYIDKQQALRLAQRTLDHDMLRQDDININISLIILGRLFGELNHLELESRILTLSLGYSQVIQNEEMIFMSLLMLFVHATRVGDIASAERFWSELDPMGRAWSRRRYRPGDAEIPRLVDRFQRGELTESELRKAEDLVRKGRNREGIRRLASLRGQFHLERGELPSAVESLAGAVRIARESVVSDARAEALLALARLRAGEPVDARSEAERLDACEGNTAIAVAELWRDLGEPDRAIGAAMCAHAWAVSDGEPFVSRYELVRARALLENLGAELPEVPSYDPASSIAYPWEDQVKLAIEKLKEEAYSS